MASPDFDEDLELNVAARADGKHDVVDSLGNVIAGGFASNAAGWSWIDRNTYEGRDDTDRVHRIQMSPSFS